MSLIKSIQMNSKIQELRKSPAWRRAMNFIQSIAAIVLASICILAMTDVERTNRRMTPKVHAQNDSTALFGAVSGVKSSPDNLAGRMPDSFDRDVAKVVADIDRIEADTLSQMDRTSLDRQGQVHTLGKLLIFDKHLSVNQDEACSFCHTPETGFTGPIQSLNETTLSYPASLRTRFSDRNPHTYMYPPFAPLLHYTA